MVFFTCNACGTSLKKNQVEKHYQHVCSNCEVLSCIDCGLEFYGDAYASHTKCISEAEKYQGSLYKECGAGKGERKQQEWVEVCFSLYQNLEVRLVQCLPILYQFRIYHLPECDIHVPTGLVLRCLLLFHLHSTGDFSPTKNQIVPFCLGSTNAPINIMPHYHPYGQMAGKIGALTKGGCPYSRAFDYL